MPLPKSKSTSAFSVYQELAKTTSESASPSFTVPSTPVANSSVTSKSSKRRSSPQSEKKQDLSDSLALALLKADLQVGKRKRKKSSLRTQLFKKRSKPYSAADSTSYPPSSTSGALKRLKRSVSNTSRSSSNPVNDVFTNPTSASKQQLQRVSLGPESERSNSAFLDAHQSAADSRERASRMFEWLMYPVKPNNFFKTIWEEKPLLLRRHDRKYFQDIFSTTDLDNILRTRNLEFGVNLDVTTYMDGTRETHNPPGIAYAPVVWDFYQSGCSVRLLNPQTFSESVWRLCSTLQDFFGCFVGANIYLTPPGSQGFAPHYDDIEAFVLQLEGKKHWRLYKPRFANEMLPRESSPNFSQDEIGEPILDVTLSAGDMLYFPRGTIHQADTPGDCHSLHVTVSTCQKNTWGDMLQKVLPQMLESAMENDVEFRKSLPRNYLSHLGTTHSESMSSKRLAMIQHLEGLVGKLKDHLMADEAADEMAADFMHQALPPYLTEDDKLCTALESGGRWQGSVVIDHGRIELDSQIRLVNYFAMRLTPGDNCLTVFTTVHNSRVYKQKELQSLELDFEYADALEFLQSNYPEFVSVSDLPAENDTARYELATVLYRSGLAMTSKPLGGSADYV